MQTQSHLGNLVNPAPVDVVCWGLGGGAVLFLSFWGNTNRNINAILLVGLSMVFADFWLHSLSGRWRVLRALQ